MDQELMIDELAVTCNVSRAEIVHAVAQIKSTFQNLANALQELADRMQRLFELIEIQDVETFKSKSNDKSILFIEILNKIKKAHCFAIEEEKKPPDSKK